VSYILASRSGDTVRGKRDPSALASVESLGTRQDPASWNIAHKISVVLASVENTRPAIVDRYLDALAVAPVEHMRLLQRRGAAIAFAPTIADALESDWATARRGRALTPRETMDARTRYSRARGAAAIFDPAIDALVMPTTYTAADRERVVLHELGHALTMERASIEPGLLKDLPQAIARHVSHPDYGDPRNPATLRSRVLEALAEGYVYLVVGRVAELPSRLTSDLIFILGTVIEDNARIRFDFDEDSGRTASFVDAESIIDASSAEHGALFAPEPKPGEPLRVIEIGGDELAPRRNTRRAA
jgi:hypothetical protein